MPGFQGYVSVHPFTQDRVLFSPLSLIAGLELRPLGSAGNSPPANWASRASWQIDTPIRHRKSETATALRQRRYGTAVRTRFYGNGYGNG